MKRRALALAGSIAALSLVGVPIAAAASSPHHGTKVESRSDRSLDVSRTRHVDKTPDRNSSIDRSSKDGKLDR